jgi:hypothetical protein
MDGNISAPMPAWDIRLQKIVILLGRLGLAYLFFQPVVLEVAAHVWLRQQLCHPAAGGRELLDGQRQFRAVLLAGHGVYLQRRPARCAGRRPATGWSAQAWRSHHAAGAGSTAHWSTTSSSPTIGVFGWLVWLAEFWVVRLDAGIGLFTRFGGLVSLGVSLAALSSGWPPSRAPIEWEWSYGLMLLLSLLMFGLAPGRIWGVDAASAPASGRQPQIGAGQIVVVADVKQDGASARGDGAARIVRGRQAAGRRADENAALPPTCAARRRPRSTRLFWPTRSTSCAACPAFTVGSPICPTAPTPTSAAGAGDELLHLQQGESLGERLDQLITQALAARRNAVVMDSDSPTLPPDYVAQAFDLLDRATRTQSLVPCRDGGYYLVGMARPLPALLHEVQMSTSTVLADTLAIAAA